MTKTTKQKQTKPAAGSQVPPDAIVQYARNVILEGGELAASGMATAEDLTIIFRAEIPPVAAKFPARNVAAGLTNDVCQVLNGQALRGYFGTRIKLGQMVEASKRFSEMDARRTRLEHAAALATQIAAPDGLLVEEELAKLMKSWPELERDFPKEALALEPLRKYWLEKHPGPKVKKTKPAETPATPTK